MYVLQVLRGRDQGPPTDSPWTASGRDGIPKENQDSLIQRKKKKKTSIPVLFLGPFHR